MVKELVHDPIFLGQKSEKATADDLQAAQDLLDTLTAHKETCVGMAANMIGVKKQIICYDDNGICSEVLWRACYNGIDKTYRRIFDEIGN